jgi:cytochrome c553
MGARRVIRWKTIGTLVLVGAFLGLIAVAALAISGVYNVAASSGHWIITDKLIRFAVRRSIVIRSLSIDAPDLSSEGLVRLGAAHYELACAACHGSPTKEPSQIVHGMLPRPPSLHNAAIDWTPEQLFWIIRNGLKLTGMPAWSDLRRDDEVWAVVAFLQRLPAMDRNEYVGLAGGSADNASAAHLAFGRSVGSEISDVCGRCHVANGEPQTIGLVPDLRGQSWIYLQRALREYRDGKRASGIMGPIASELQPAEIDQLAPAYAQRLAIKEKTDSETSPSVGRGRVIAEQGLPQQGIPPCMVCHGASASPQYPRLRGLSEEYVATQLSLWQRGLRDLTTYGAVMSTIAKRLSGEQIGDVSAFVGALDPLQGTPGTDDSP